MKKHTRFVYAIFYVERKYSDKINQDLKKRGYDNMKATIPMVKILKKTLKGTMTFEEVPILFNYGFMKMPAELAFSRPFLHKMRREIPGIRSWLKNTESMHPKKKKARIDNAEDFDDFSIVAIATRKEVRRFRRLAKENKKFSIDDLIRVKPGDYIVLRGYPYEGVDATVLEVDHLCKRVKVLVYPENGRMEIWLPFDNVIYSVYYNYDPDKLYANAQEFDPNQITSEDIDEIIKNKQI